MYNEQSIKKKNKFQLLAVYNTNESYEISHNTGSKSKRKKWNGQSPKQPSLKQQTMEPLSVTQSAYSLKYKQQKSQGDRHSK